MRQTECVISLRTLSVLAVFLSKYPLKYLRRLSAFPLTRLNGSIKWKNLGRERKM